jgi:hydroxyacylglutathione hydrolase
MHAMLMLWLTGSLLSQAANPDGGGVRPGTLPKAWRTGGPNCMEMPNWQIHEYNSDFYILRESGCLNYEKPFLYLLFGREKSFLIDTGAGDTDVGQTVSGVIEKWAVRNHREPPPLVVGHSHSHDDHTAGDAQFKARPNTNLVPLTVAGTSRFFGIARWPEDTGHIDLGDRMLDVIAIPGHDILSLAYYDRQTGVLFAGDSLYPGRLYVRDFPAFTASTERLVRFTQDKIVAHVLGCHIEEQRTPYLDYPIGTQYQPDEHSLELGRGSLMDLNDALGRMQKPARVALRDLTIWPVSDPVDAPDLQTVHPVAKFSVPGFPDWLAIDESVWVSNKPRNSISRIDPHTNRVLATITTGKEPCAGLTVAFGSVWVPNCGDQTISRFDAQTAKLLATLPVNIADTEGTIAAGEGSVWMPSDASGVLTRIDPNTDRVVARIPVPAGSFAAVVGEGAVWVTCTKRNLVSRVDPKAGKVIATIAVGPSPRFLAVGLGAVWTLNQGDGSVSRIDPATNQVTATILVGVPGEGGDIDTGEGAVWVTAMGKPLSRIDPATNTVVKQFVGKGGDALRVGHGSLWLSNHEFEEVWRIDPKAL